MAIRISSEVKKKGKYFTILLVAFLVLPIEIIACQCYKTSNKFTSRLHKASFVGFIEIIGYDTIKDHDFDRSFTIVKVIEQFQGKPIGNTVLILDGSENIECQRSFGYFPIGQKFIIKAHFENRKDHEFDFEDTPLPNINSYGPQVLAMSICSENVIAITGEIANGKITKPINQIFNVDQVLSMIRKRTKLS